jgi:carotenoid cleavage dioxygenase
VIFRGATCTSDLAVLDATDVEAGPVALAHVPVRVPAGFHGNFVGEGS